MKRTLSGTTQTLPPLPFLAHDILIATASDDADLAGIAEKISREPGIAARIIGIANSAFYHGSRPIHSVEGAIVRLGVKRVRMLTLSTLLADSFDTKKCRAFKPDLYWYQAMGTAHCASLIAPALPGLDPEAAYLGGLLHNIGLLLLVSTFPSQMSDILALHAAEPARSLAALIRERLGTDHHDAGQLLLSGWGLPPAICATTGAASFVSDASAQAPLVNLIDFCARWTTAGYAMPPPDDAPQLPAERFEALSKDCRQQQRQLMDFARLLGSA